LQGDAVRRQESEFGQRATSLYRKQQMQPFSLSNLHEVARMSKEPENFYGMKARNRARSGGSHLAAEN
jgi:hypothetical protein